MFSDSAASAVHTPPRRESYKVFRGVKPQVASRETLLLTISHGRSFSSEAAAAHLLALILSHLSGRRLKYKS